MAKYTGRSIIVTYLDTVATVDILTTNNDDVNLVETRNDFLLDYYFKSSSCFDSVNKLDCNFLHWQLLSLFCLPPEKPHDILLFSHQSFSKCKDGRYHELGLFLLTISIHYQKKRLWDFIKWSSPPSSSLNVSVGP